MFHSAGYFRGVSCPFFEHGLCHRPHCHYRHARSSSKARPRKPPQLKTRRICPSHSEQQGVQPGAAPLQGGEEGSQETTSERGPAEVAAKEGEAEKGPSETVGGVVSFYGSSSEATLPAADAACDPQGVVQHAEETALKSAIAPHVLQTPLYAPEKCLARESVYSGDLSSPVTLGGNVEIFEDLEPPSISESPEAVREPLPLLAEHELGRPVITEQEIFGSSDELTSDGEGASGEGASDGGDAAAAEVKPAVEVSLEELVRIEEEFVKATNLLSSSARDLKTDGRKRKAADSADLSTSAKKQRVAHRNASSAGALVQTILQSKPKATSNFAAALDLDALYMGKKRVVKPATTEPGAAVKRPRLSLTVNAKIPTSLRQKFLNSFIDEHLKMTSDPQQAYDKALTEERQLFERSSRRQLYLNLSTIALKRLRAQAEQLAVQQRERSDARVRVQREGGGAPTGHPPHTSQDVASKKSHKTADSGKGKSSKVHDSRKGERRKAAVKLIAADTSSTISEAQIEPGGGGVVFPMSQESQWEESPADSSPLFRSSHFYSQSDEVPAAERRSKGKAPMKAGKSVSKGLKEKRKKRKTSSEAAHVVKSKSPRTAVGEEESPRTRVGEEESPRTNRDEEELPRIQSRCKLSSSGGSGLVADLFGSSDSDDATVTSPGVAVTSPGIAVTSPGTAVASPGATVSSPGSSSGNENAGMSFESILGSMDDKVVRGRRLMRSRVRERNERAKGIRRRGRPETSLAGLASDQEPVETVSEDRPEHAPSLSLPGPDPSQPDRVGRVNAPSAELVRSMCRFVQKRGSCRVGRGAVEAATSTDRTSTSSLESEQAGTPVDPTSLHLPAGPFINLTKVALAHPRGKPSLPASIRRKPSLPTAAKGPSVPAATRKKKPQKKASLPTDPAPKPTFTIFKKKEVVLTSTLFHSHLRNYLLTEEQLVGNGYPRPTEQEGVASINRAGESPPDIQPVGPNAMRHRCCRCSNPFIIYNSGQYQTVEECVYHFGRLVKMREYGEGVVSKYTCCQERRDSSGCQVAKMHVTSGAHPLRDSGYACTPPPPSPSPSSQLLAYALDCEMCYTTAGLQLTRVSVVDMELRPVFESLVKPSHPIVDYNTRFSGLTAEDFVSVETTLEEVQQQLLRLFHKDTILLGHSLESDLRALKLIHSSVVDTAIVFPHRKGPPYKRALRTLMVEYVHKFIQDSVDGGHDSLEDSQACMELMLWKVKADLQKTTRRVSSD